MAAPARQVVIADDLTGAVESTAALAGLGPDGGEAAIVALDLPTLAQAGTAIAACDLNCRNLAAAEAAERLSAAMTVALDWAGSAGGRLKKIDSLWRGNTVAEVAALARRGPAVLVPALPELDRTVTGGRLRRPAAAGGELDLTACLAGVVVPVELRVVRSSGAVLAAQLRAIWGLGRLPLLDSVSADDLDRIVAVLADWPDRLVIGCGGVAAALGRRRAAQRLGLTEPDGPTQWSDGTGPDGADQWSDAPDSGGPAQWSARLELDGVAEAGGRPVAILVGSAEPRAREQIRRLAELGYPVETVDPAEAVELAETVGPVETGDAAETGGLVGAVGPVAGTAGTDPAAACAWPVPVRVFTSLEPAPDQGLDDGQAARAVVARALAWRPAADCVATGGSTARALVEALGLAWLRPLVQVHPGAVVSLAGDGRLVATRPGSFGQLDSLAAMLQGVHRLRGASSGDPTVPDAPNLPTVPVD
ncbi:MAG: hypothetical protein LBK54_00815 [Propionibacteriaceae bacterium]|jgi:4-hydroxythreonine-4-phosphate dehydrogenase|nr:hypothetical protein [Propionibacteriaceae bacterium]